MSETLVKYRVKKPYCKPAIIRKAWPVSRQERVLLNYIRRHQNNSNGVIKIELHIRPNEPLKWILLS